MQIQQTAFRLFACFRGFSREDNSEFVTELICCCQAGFIQILGNLHPFVAGNSILVPEPIIDDSIAPLRRIDIAAVGIFHRTVEGLDISPSALMSDFTDKQTQELIASVSMLSVTEETAKKYIDDNLRQFTLKELHMKRAECIREMSLEKDTKKKSKLNEKKKKIEEKLKQMNNL